MKKILLALVLASVLVLGAACGGGGNNNPPAPTPPQETVDDPTLDTYEGDGKVVYDTTLFNEWANDNPFTITATEKGLQMESVQPRKTPCSKQRFPIENGQKVSFTFSLPTYQEDLTGKTGLERFIDTGTAIRTNTIYDIILREQTAEKSQIQFRIYGETSETSVNTESCNTRVLVGPNGANVVWESGWATTTETNVVPTHRITGSMRESSSFTFVFDKENIISTYLDGDTTELKPLLNASVPEEKAVIDKCKELFADAKSVNITVRGQGKTKDDLESAGINDREATECIVFSEICGQSLRTADTRIADTAAPYVSDPVLIEGGELAAYNTYTLEIKSNEANAPANSTVIYSNFSSDVLCWSSLESWLKITYPDGTTSNIRGLKFSTKEAGTYKIAVTVRDGAFNTYTSNALTVEVKDTYRINLEGTIPETAAKGSSFTLPSAYVTNAEGSRKDAEGNDYTYTVEVENPLGMPVEVDEDGKFTFTLGGQYVIRYTSESADGSDTREYKVTVS